jgi:hypothetical protein
MPPKDDVRVVAPSSLRYDGHNAGALGSEVAS